MGPQVAGHGLEQTHPESVDHRQDARHLALRQARVRVDQDQQRCVFTVDVDPV